MNDDLSRWIDFYANATAFEAIALCAKDQRAAEDFRRQAGRARARIHELAGGAR